jgi:cell division protein FtsB
VDSSVVGYDGAVRDEEHSVWQTKPEREQKEETKQSRWGFRGKTVWDFLQLLIVPLILVAIGLVFSLQQDARQQRVEDQRAEAERELAEQRAQDEALQAYLDQMSQLMLERKLLEAEPGDPVYTLAQARTSTAILSLDAEHNQSVTRFLINSGLAESSDGSPRLLSEIALPRATLSSAELSSADLSLADLRWMPAIGHYLCLLSLAASATHIS